MKTLGGIIKIITMIVMFAVLELNKNSLFGWFLTFVCTGLCFFVSAKINGFKNVLVYFIWVAVFVLILFFQLAEGKICTGCEGKRSFENSDL